MKKTLIIIFVCVIALGAIIFLILGGKVDYKKAYENTQNLKNYTMEISTIATMDNGVGKKQSVVDQVIKVSKKGKRNMLYSVESKSNSADSETGESLNAENTYVYMNNFYYYDYPGVRYKGPVEFDKAVENIENLSSVISFPEDKIEVYSKEKTDEGTRYDYQVSYEDVSDFIKATLESAISVFEGEDFYADYMSASSTVEGKYIKKSSFVVKYISDEGHSVKVEIYTKLGDTSAEVEKPKDNEYQSIYT